MAWKLADFELLMLHHIKCQIPTTRGLRKNLLPDWGRRFENLGWLDDLGTPELGRGRFGAFCWFSSTVLTRSHSQAISYKCEWKYWINSSGVCSQIFNKIDFLRLLHKILLTFLSNSVTIDRKKLLESSRECFRTDMNKW